MDWTEINIYTKANFVDEITTLLMLCQIDSVQIIDKEEDARFLKANVNQGNYADYVEDELLNPTAEPVIVRFYLPAKENAKLNAAKTAMSSLIDSAAIKLEEVTTHSSTWENKWKEHYKPFPVGQNIVIAPVWENYRNPNKTVFVIEPGHLFGTGLHESTRQSIVELEDRAKGAVVLDLGCGTGILPILAMMLGAKQATAVDIEPTATEIVAQNAVLNDTIVDIKIGNILTDKSFANELLHNSYTIVTANIVADVIIAMLPFVLQVLDGFFICAGIITERETDVKTALCSMGFKIVHTTYQNGWVCIVSERNRKTN
ncbi:MAG: 50S ribosomal protein L11 methyltransferase [Defluviitaleaceae bacterium]|nr:50S ribosomal protein L11 methyltransferase [Defluviitaleaceae bacterium]